MLIRQLHRNSVYIDSDICIILLVNAKKDII